MKRDIGKIGGGLGEKRKSDGGKGCNSRRKSRTIKLKLVAELSNCIFDSGVGGGGWKR